MKYLIILLIVISFFSCKKEIYNDQPPQEKVDTTWKIAPISKEPSATERASVYTQVRGANHDTATDFSFTPFTKNIKGGGAETALWGSMTFPNGVWFQWGYWEDCKYVSMTFNTGTHIVRYRNLAPVPILSKNQYHEFRADHIGGGIWAISVDGLVFNEFDFGAEYMTTKSVSGEITYSNKQPTFPNIHIKDIKMKVNGVWQVPPYAIAQGTGWGIKGKEQDNNLVKGELYMGSTLLELPYGTKLWQ